MLQTFTNDAVQINAAIHGITNTLIGSLTATDQKRILVTPHTSAMPDGAVLKIDDIVLTTETADAIDTTNYWSFQVVDVTNTLNLLATAVSNYTGGTAISADTPYRITPDQNNELGTSTVIELSVTKAASATELVECSIDIHWHWEV